MSAKNLKKLILEFTADICFDYDNKSACINPWNENKFEVGYGDDVMLFNNIDDLMSATVFDGKSLNEIADKITVSCV